MHVTFLGTSAGEGYPGFWCDCPHCRYAREHGGRNLRGNSCALVDDALLLDMNDHFFVMVNRLGLRLDRIEHLLVTHPHVDHFTPWKLTQRAVPADLSDLSEDQLKKRISPNFTPLPRLHVYGNRFVQAEMARVPRLLDAPDAFGLAFHLITEGQTFSAGPYTVTAVRANHGPEPGFAFNYILQRDGKTLLYASDTGGYDADMLAVLERFRFDCVILEGTFGLGASVPSHMSLEKNRAMLRYLNEKGLWAREPNLHITHICPHWAPPHDQYAPMLAAEGMEAAYDGKRIDF
ncbi:MAG TPA: MBL fold metallo-hydrolase [Clostridia bacterium]|nr:MBL fold metallo-hydrolase [Clostridia bacterium]